ncbi:hypothetical protein HDU86_003483 [Geranomyces michiganensis]|nr:hypothetical protein HDU86_003483 [Geranomyces michiganensis]
MTPYETVAVTPPEATISDLAAEARKSDKKASLWKRVHVPLLVLAPVLILLALAAVVVPVAIVLTKSSHDVTEDLSQTYFASIMASTQYKIYHSLDPQRLALISFGPLGPTAQAMTSRYNILGETALWKQMAYLTKSHKLGVPTTPPGTLNTLNVSWVSIGPRIVPPYNQYAVAMEDLSSNGNAMQFAIDQQSFALVNASAALISITKSRPFNMTTYAMNGNMWPIGSIPQYDITVSPNLQELLVPSPRRDIFFTLAPTPQGAIGASLNQLYTSADPALLYSCGATITIDLAWSKLLRDAAGKDSLDAPNKIILLNSNPALSLISTSNRNYTAGAGGAAVLQNTNETLSQSLRSAVIAKYGTYAGLTADPNLGESFEAEVEGATWILLVGRIKLSDYDTDYLVAVLAVPRASIFARIDSAQNKSMGLAIGLSVGIGMLMALLFALIVTPLRRLAIAMGMLTNMDFASLQKDNILEGQSLISEIRNVQGTFSTMVKAFAGGIKKNKEMVFKQSRQGGGASSTTQSKTGLQGANAGGAGGDVRSSRVEREIV